MKSNMPTGFEAPAISADRLVFIACILLGWLALELVQSLH